MKKGYESLPVLLVVGTGDETCRWVYLKEGEKKYKNSFFRKNNRFRWNAGFLMESKKDKKNLKKYPKEFREDPLKLHYKSVEEAIRIAQKKGYVVYSTEKKSTPFYTSIKKRGKEKTGIEIKKIIFSKGFKFFKATELYRKIVEKNRIPSKIIVCGHWRGV